MQEKKLHHYVPKFYLKNFLSKNNRLMVFNKENENSSEIKNLGNIAAEKYLYTIDINGKPMTTFLQIFLDTQEIKNNLILKDFSKWLCEFLDDSLYPLASGQNKDVVEKTNNLIKKYFHQKKDKQEDLFCFYEDRFQLHYQKILNDDYSCLKRDNNGFCIPHLCATAIEYFLKKSSETFCNGNSMKLGEILKNYPTEKNCNDSINYSFIEILHYMCIQLMRTSKAFNCYKSSDLDKRLGQFPRCCIIFLIHTGSINLCNNLFKSNYKFTILKNKSKINFITSDCPVLNLLYEQYELNNDNDDVKLFFPLSNKIALLLTNEIKNKDEYIEEVINDDNVIEIYNELMREKSEQFYYGNW